MKPLLFAVTLALAASAMQAETINFDDISVPGLYTPITAYAGLSWNNFYAGQGASLGNGYAAGVVSSPNIAFNPGGNPASFSSTTLFDLTSGYFTAAGVSGLQVSVTGYNNGTLVNQTTLTLNPSGPILETFNWTGLTEVDFVSGGPGTQFVMDNLTIGATSTAPEPASVYLLLFGAGALGLVGLRRRQAQAQRV